MQWDQVKLTVKALSLGKKVMGEADGVYEPAATEKTNINLYHSEKPVYSPKVCPILLTRGVAESLGSSLKCGD